MIILLAQHRTGAPWTEQRRIGVNHRRLSYYSLPTSLRNHLSQCFPFQDLLLVFPLVPSRRGLKSQQVPQTQSLVDNSLSSLDQG